MISQRYGGLKILLHPEKIKSFLEEIITAPIYVRVKPTNKCNHNCSFCSYDPKKGDLRVRDEMKNRTDEISREKMLEIISDFKDIGVKAVTYSGGGEPLVYPHINEIMKKTLENGINLSIISNGQRLNKESAEILSNANWVRISSNTDNARLFQKVRGISEKYFLELEENIKSFAKIKNQKCELGINFVVEDKNFDRVYSSIKYFKDLGVNHVKITPMWIDNFFNYHNPMKQAVLDQIIKAKSSLEDNDFSIYSTYEVDFSSSSVSERDYNRCYMMQTVPVVAANSKVYFCHDKAYSSGGLLGSIKDISFKDLWFSDESKEIFRNFNPSESCKHHCANDSKNKLLNKITSQDKEYSLILSALSCYGNDVNFI